VTGSGSGVPGRGDVAAPAQPRAAIGQLAIILAAGLAFRLILAYLLPGSGFANDLGAFTAWARNLAAEGPFGFYDRPFFHDYTPGYLYVLWLIGLVGQALGGIGDLIKVPAILADLALAWLAHRMVLDLGASSRRALIAAAIVIVNPITWFDSVVWGQVDSFGVVFLLLAVRELWKGRTERAAILAVAAALIKPQLGILAPLVAAVTIRRALTPAASLGDEPEAAPSGTAWERRTHGPIRILTTGLAGFLTAVAISSPFGLWVIAPAASFPFVDSPLLGQIFSTAAGYPYLTVNAYNLWALVDVGGSSLAANGLWINDAPIEGQAFAAVLGIPAVVFGSLGLLAVILGTSLVVARRPDRLTILVGLAVLALAFFAVPTRVHERYSFPFFAVAAILAAVSLRWRAAYVVASFATFANMYVVLTTLYDNPMIDDWLGLGPAIRAWSGVALVAVLHTLALLWALAQLRDGARHRLADELAEAAPERDAWPGEVEELPPAARTPHAAPAGAPLLAVGRDVPATSSTPVADPVPVVHPVPAGRRVPAWFDRPSLDLLGPVAWLRARMGETPVRPDRSRLLAREGRGRFDRLDVWILVVLVVASLFLRTFRLAEPTRMHFDEVYHARTATEVLQHWRYGIDHNVYEWTHPHLAKYAMALGLVAFPGHDVESSSDLGVPVRDAAIEPRRPDISGRTADDGDRLWVATGSEVVAYDLAARTRVGAWAIPGAAAVHVDTTSGVPALFVGTDGGEVLGIDLTEVEIYRADSPQDSVAPYPVASLGAPVAELALLDGGGYLGVRLAGDVVAIVDVASGTEAGRATVAGAADLSVAGRGSALVATISEIVDPDAVAAELVALIGGDAEAYAAALRSTDRDEVTLGGAIGSEREDVDAAIADGRLGGIRVDQVAWLAVAGAEELVFLSPAAEELAALPVDGGIRGLALASGVEDGTQLWGTTTDPATGEPTLTVFAVTGDGASNGPTQRATLPLPGAGTEIVFDRSAELVHVIGTTPDGTGTTMYVVEPHGRSVFADHRLPFAPAAWALDTNDQYPATDRAAMLAFSPDGTAASMDVGHYAFAWRLPGVIAGALTTAVLFLLARLLFARRAVAVFTGLFVVLDGMFFVQSRIAMNDVYVGLFILAAYLVFARLWADPDPPRRAFWIGLPAVGVLLGLALASKWVAAYAIGALGILVLTRSALGRVLLILGMIGVTAVLGYMAMSVPADNPAARGNILFVLIMVALTLAAVVISVYRPVAWSREELRFAIGAPVVLGATVAAGLLAAGVAFEPLPVGPAVPMLLAAAGLAALGLLAGATFLVAARAGFGPLAPRGPVPAGERAAEAAPSPAPAGWLRLGSGFGLPALWLGVSLLVIPLGVYIGSYVPWALIDNHRLWDGFPAEHTGQTLVALTGEMYRYHNELTAAHAASSPWWAWPLNLKPVWFYQGSFANGTGAAIYDAGNLVIWWLGIPAMVFAAVQAYRRRSLALALIVIGFLAQWIAWARIDRASFQYHYYTSLPFVVLALGYMVAELWHGASRRTWLLARAAAAAALLLPVLFWVLKGPLCAFVGVEAANPGSQACVGNPGTLEVTVAAGAIAIVGIVTGVVLVWLLARLGRPKPDGRPTGPRDLVPLLLAAVGGGAALAVARGLPAGDPVLTIPGLIPELIGLIVALPLGLVALQIATARDARRFVMGLVVAVGAWFAILYPNIAALPLPNTIVNAYQGILPTYIYAFQVPVNQIPRGSTSFADAQFLLFVGALFAAALAVAYSAWVWRAALVDGTDDDEPGAPGASGGNASPSGVPGPA
jgi:Gpi18-like mannosyltransferase